MNQWNKKLVHWKDKQDQETISQTNKKKEILINEILGERGYYYRHQWNSEDHMEIIWKLIL
jgi:hypothetical protein